MLFRSYDSISNTIKKQEFASEVNTYFIENGYGWKFENSEVLFRGNEIEEHTFAILHLGVIQALLVIVGVLHYVGTLV